jgi:hypothetical protein
LKARFDRALGFALPVRICKVREMLKLCIFAGTTIFSIAGGYLATLFGMDAFSFGSFFLSGIGSIVGVYVGWKVGQHYK